MAKREREKHVDQGMTGRLKALCHISPLFPKVGDVWQPGEKICHNFALANSKSDLELEWLEGEVPAGETAVVVLHGVQPGQSMMVGL